MANDRFFNQSISNGRSKKTKLNFTYRVEESCLEVSCFHSDGMLVLPKSKKRETVNIPQEKVDYEGEIADILKTKLTEYISEANSNGQIKMIILIADVNLGSDGAYFPNFLFDNTVDFNNTSIYKILVSGTEAIILAAKKFLEENAFITENEKEKIIFSDKKANWRKLIDKFIEDNKSDTAQAKAENVGVGEAEVNGAFSIKDDAISIDPGKAASVSVTTVKQVKKPFENCDIDEPILKRFKNQS